MPCCMANWPTAVAVRHINHTHRCPAAARHINTPTSECQSACRLRVQQEKKRTSIMANFISSASKELYEVRVVLSALVKLTFSWGNCFRCKVLLPLLLLLLALLMLLTVGYALSYSRVLVFASSRLDATQRPNATPKKRKEKKRRNKNGSRKMAKAQSEKEKWEKHKINVNVNKLIVQVVPQPTAAKSQQPTANTQQPVARSCFLLN